MHVPEGGMTPVCSPSWSDQSGSADIQRLDEIVVLAQVRSAPATSLVDLSRETIKGGWSEFLDEYYLLIFAIVAYSCTSLAVVYFNWWLFTKGFKFPVFVSWIQQVVGLFIFFLGSKIALYFSSLRPIFPRANFDIATCWKVIPLSVSFVLTIGLANICLQKTLISTYQVARSLTLLFVIILSYLLLKEKQSIFVLLACSLMVVGFVIGSLDPETLSLGGLIAGGFSSFFQSLYNVLIKKTMPAVHDDNQLLLYYNVMLSSLLFLPMCLLAESVDSWRQAFSLTGDTSMFVIWGGMFLSGLLGTTLNMTQYLVVKATSPLTFNIVGFSKSLIQSLGGIVFFGDKVSIESASGLGLCMIGSALYAKAKNDNVRKAKQQAKSEKAEKAGLLEQGSASMSTPTAAADKLKVRSSVLAHLGSGNVSSASTVDPTPIGTSIDILGHKEQGLLVQLATA